MNDQHDAIDATAGFNGDVLPAVGFDAALHRVRAYCTAPTSGWAAYDLCGVQARMMGLFESISPWSLLWADALAGQVQVGDVSRFDLAQRHKLAVLLASVPADVDLDQLAPEGVAAVARVCKFGFAGVWAPKSTKMSALYRPRSVPVLDGYVAMAFGYPRDGFSEGLQPRWLRIERVVQALADTLRRHQRLLRRLRDEAGPLVPDLDLIPDLRLLDIIIWTAQDDRLARPGKPANSWLNTSLDDRQPITFGSVAPIPVTTQTQEQRDPQV